MSDRQTPESRLHALTDPHASIVGVDGSVRPTDTRPIPGWQNHAGGATRGVKEYRGDQHAGVDNSVQAAQGCRLAAGVSDGADLCTLGTADFPIRSGHDVVADMERAFAAMAQRDPIPATGMADVFLPPGEFDMVVRAQGIETQSLAGQQYWEWQGGGIRYWRGHREMPSGAAQ